MCADLSIANGSIYLIINMYCLKIFNFSGGKNKNLQMHINNKVEPLSGISSSISNFSTNKFLDQANFFTGLSESKKPSLPRSTVTA